MRHAVHRRALVRRKAHSGGLLCRCLRGQRSRDGMDDGSPGLFQYSQWSNERRRPALSVGVAPTSRHNHQQQPREARRHQHHLKQQPPTTGDESFCALCGAGCQRCAADAKRPVEQPVLPYDRHCRTGVPRSRNTAAEIRSLSRAHGALMSYEKESPSGEDSLC